MYEFSCKKAGAEGCGFKTTAATEAELKEKITAHAQAKHNVAGMTDTIFNYMTKISQRS
jgi:predicted small metal-binding protein